MSISIKFRKDRNAWELTHYPNGKRERVLYKERADAERDARKMQLGLGPEDRSSISLFDAGQTYYNNLSLRRKSKGSQRNDKRYINLFYHFMTVERGIERLASITLEDMEAFRDWLTLQTEFDDKPMSMGPKTVNRCLAVLKHFFIQHVRWKNIVQTPCVYLEFLTAEDNDRNAATKEQYFAALEQAADWFKPVMHFIYLTGAPGSSVQRLEWSDVDFRTRQFAIFRKKGKEAKWKRIPMNMTPEVFEVFELLHSLNPVAIGPVFRDDRGRPLTADRIGKAGSKAFKSAGIEAVTLYSLRHALASDLAAKNHSMEIVRQAMGHSNIATSQRYANKIGSKPVVEAINTVRSQNAGGKVVAIAIEKLRIKKAKSEAK